MKKFITLISLFILSVVISILIIVIPIINRTKPKDYTPIPFKSSRLKTDSLLTIKNNKLIFLNENGIADSSPSRSLLNTIPITMTYKIMLEHKTKNGVVENSYNPKDYGLSKNELVASVNTYIVRFYKPNDTSFTPQDYRFHYYGSFENIHNSYIDGKRLYVKRDDSNIWKLNNLTNSYDYLSVPLSQDRWFISIDGVTYSNESIDIDKKPTADFLKVYDVIKPYTLERITDLIWKK